MAGNLTGPGTAASPLASPPSWKPTRKWWAQVTGGLASIAASWILSGAFDDVERGMVATLITASVASYWLPNVATRGGETD
jgi:hypothetical protein